VFDDVPDDEEIVAEGNIIGLAGETTPCNWLQTHEVVMFRRLLRQQIEAVQAGRDPLGVIFKPGRATVQVEAGNFILTGVRS
jgi:hypothetical protein